MAFLLKDIAVQSLALLAVALLLVSAFGPMVDHHFAERHPGHGHFYLGAADPVHTHPFEHSHIHYDELYAPAPGDEGIVYFAPHDGSGHAPADVASTVIPSSPVFDETGDPSLLSGDYGLPVLRGAFVDPPHRPPGV